MSLGNRMKSTLKKSGLKQREFAEQVEQDLTSLNKVLNGERTPSYELLEKFISFFPDLDLNWLMRDNYHPSEDYAVLNEDSHPYNIMGDIEKIEGLLADLKEKLSQK